MPTKTTILVLTRHEEHENNVLTTEGADRARRRGQVLGKTAQIEAAVSSPLPRAVSTAERMLEGAGISLLIENETRLGDFKTDKRAAPDSLNRLKEMAKSQFGNDDDSSLAKCLPEMPELHELMLMRAEEGATALTEIAVANPGKFVLVTSHGVARMEVAMQWLNGHRSAAEVLDIANNLVDRGESVLATFQVKDGKATFISAKPLKIPLD